MALEALESLLEAGKGGLFFVPSAPMSAVRAAAKGADFSCFHIDGRKIERKEQLLNAFSTALRFPEHFGHNWDALEECLSESDWGEGDGCVVYYEHVDGLLAAHPDQFETLVEICRDAVASWKDDDTALVFLFSGAKAPKGVPKLKG